MEESDIEAVALKSRKKNGYTYYGPNGGGAGYSTLKLLTCVFGIAALFMVTGLMLGYYIGFDEATSTLWRPFAPVPVPDAPVDIPEIKPFKPLHDHFASFKRDGVRYGADYGRNTINNVQASRSLLSDPDTDELCANRRCCHPTNGVSDEEGQQCWALTRSECCDLLARDICDWNCEEDVPNVNADHVVRPGRKRNKTCAGHSNGEGVFSEDLVADEDVVDHGDPQTAADLQDRDGLLSEDQCGDLYQSLIDDETADYEMAHYGEILSEALAAAEDEDMRRMKVFGSDSREWMTDKAYPQNQIGTVVVFGAGIACSGVKVSYKHILTAGHCCHSGGSGGDWYSDRKWYPGVTWMSDESSDNEYSVGRATVFSGWTNDKNWDYDVCWLTLHNSYYGWMGYGYNTGISSSWMFNLWGYPGDKWGYPNQPVKWGHDDCTPNKGIHTNQLHFDCDITKGMSGSGLWLSSNNAVYCVLSFENDAYNGCARITSDKFNTMVDSMTAAGGWTG